jgi:hypothetical protein
MSSERRAAFMPVGCGLEGFAGGDELILGEGRTGDGESDGYAIHEACRKR